MAISNIFIKRGSWSNFQAAQAVKPLGDGELALITDKKSLVAGFNGQVITVPAVFEGKADEKPLASDVQPGTIFIELEEDGIAHTGKVFISSGIDWVDPRSGSELINDAEDGTGADAHTKVWSIARVLEEFVKTKEEVASQRDWKDSVVVASTDNISPLSGLLEVDGVTLVAGDRVLVKNQTTPAENGIYVAGEDAWELANDSKDLTAGAAVTIEDGSQKNQGFILSKDLETWVKFTDGNYTAGNGLDKNGSVFSVKADTVTENSVPVAVSVNGVSTLFDNKSLKKEANGLSVKLSDQFETSEIAGISLVTVDGGTF